MNLPVTEFGPKSVVTFSIGAEPVHRFRVKLAAGKPDYWVAVDLERFSGKTIRVDVENFRGEDAYALMRLSDTLEGRERIYQEDLRPKFHFSAIAGWLNDPNGLMYYKGTYFLFAQLNPYFRWCDNMHWLLATSTDLIHWEDKGLVLHSDHYSQRFSGSGVVDENNDSGLQEGEEKPLLLFYTHAAKEFTQRLAYSTDGGKTFRDYDHNPLLPQLAPGNRDPKVIRHPCGKGWLMSLYMDGNDYAIFASDDLLHWEKTCVLTLPGCLECPDIYEIFLDEDPQKPYMVFSCAGGQYLVGHMEGNRFVAETDIQLTYCGHDVYAPQTFYGMEDGRRIQIICSSNETMLPGEAFGKFLTIPCELTLRSSPDGMKLFNQPVRELRGLEKGVVQEHTEICLEAGKTCVFQEPVSGLYRAEFTLDASMKGKLRIKVCNLEVVYNGLTRAVEYKGEQYFITPRDARIHFDLVADRCSAELFCNDGEVYLPAVAPLDQALPPLRLEASEQCTVHHLRIAELQSLLPWSEV